MADQKKGKLEDQVKLDVYTVTLITYQLQEVALLLWYQSISESISVPSILLFDWL